MPNRRAAPVLPHILASPQQHNSDPTTDLNFHHLTTTLSLLNFLVMLSFICLIYLCLTAQDIPKRGVQCLVSYLHVTRKAEHEL
jgi:hypothetical protein